MRVAGTEEDKPILGIPRVVGVAVRRVEPEPVLIVVHVEELREVSAVALYEVPSVTPEGHHP